ncbi:MAG: hypothetical protein HRU28_11220 [Rhizobiales bacterium]|nr:hypothetical protein [Hyphomicrobiales bacterium]
MGDSSIFQEIMLEWDGDAIIFNEVSPVAPTSNGDFNLRVLASMRRTSLQDMVNRFATSIGIVTADIFPNTYVGNAILAFCIITLINPFKVKILSGKGIDPLIEMSAFDEETGERFIDKRKFLVFCREHNIPSDLLVWMENNGFVYTDNNRVVFKNNFTNGEILSTA